MLLSGILKPRQYWEETFSLTSTSFYLLSHTSHVNTSWIAHKSSMAELRFHDPNPPLQMRKRVPHQRSNRGRDFSPDSVIFTHESNLSLFSSASASAGRCSYASDTHDGDCLSSTEVSSHLAGSGNERDERSLSGPDLLHHIHTSDSNKSTVHCGLGRKAEKAKVLKEKEDNTLLLHHVDNEIQHIDSDRNSFSLALRECQERRSRSEALDTRKLDRQRPASLDFNNSAPNFISSSPRVTAIMNKEKEVATTITSRKSSGNFPSPGTPSYRQCNKGWSSERVPLSSGNGIRKQVSGAGLPLINGRPLPSKWEDAERWIFSPVANDGYGRSSYQYPQRKPKSKSGPLGPPGSAAYYSLYSPNVQMYDGGYVNNHLVVASPFSAGAMAADRLSNCGGNGDGRRSFSNKNHDHFIARSASVHGCTDLVCQSSYSSSQDGVDAKDAASNITRAVSRRDMATQMSPEGSFHSSPRRSSFSSPSRLPIVEVQSYGSSKSKVRDVEVDERVTVTRWSKKNRSRRVPGIIGSEGVDDWKLKDVSSSSWEVSENVKGISKVKREEARITAWENLQQAKAEAAIRKLEMKLEKKRSSSMDKIMSKLKSAQKKAQKMRNAVLANDQSTSHDHQGSKSFFMSKKVALTFHRTRQIGSLSGCFTCHAQ